MDKLLSGRFWLAIIAGVVLVMMARRPDAPTEAIFAIIATVFTSYFQRNQMEKPN